MLNSPEGLNYGTSHQGEKNKLEPQLEKGKYDSARHSSYANECDSAEMLRHADGGSKDPMYKDKHKNM